MSKIEDKIDVMTGIFYGTSNPKNEQGAIFGVMVEALRQQVITNELLVKQQELLEKQYEAMRQQKDVLGRLLMKGR